MPYSQNDEEKILLDYIAANPMGDYPHFIDCGAYHPTVFSNTRCLVERGWGGVYIEPAPSNFDLFLKEYRSNASILLVNAAVSTKSELLEFYDSNGDALSTFSADHVARWQASGVKFRNYLVHTVTWEELFVSVGTNFAVMSLDVEQLNYELFTALPLGKLDKLKVIIVEHDGRYTELEELAGVHGFKKLSMNGENLILVR